MKNKTAIFLLATLTTVTLATVGAPSARADGVVIRIGTSFGLRLPAVCAPPVYAVCIQFNRE